jgi:hypothetical protein
LLEQNKVWSSLQKNRKFSVPRILSWIFIREDYHNGLDDGIHLSEFTKNTNQETAAKIGQAGTFICIKFIFLKGSRWPTSW